MKCIDKWRICTAGCCCLATKSSKALVPAAAWMTCANTVLNQRNQDCILLDFIYMKGSEKTSPETVSSITGWTEGQGGGVGVLMGPVFL